MPGINKLIDPISTPRRRSFTFSRIALDRQHHVGEHPQGNDWRPEKLHLNGFEELRISNLCLTKTPLNIGQYSHNTAFRTGHGRFKQVMTYISDETSPKPD